MRLIDADAFEKWLRKARENCYANEIHDCEDEGQMTNINDELYFSTQSFIDTMKYRPTIDAEPVRHGGEWIHLGGDEWCCSYCGDVIYTEGSWEAPSKKYCSECGAKMDAEVQDG